ncbi:MAG TPA: glycosyltransferase family 39 protein [Candidatus Sumerlaeota bacterium]|nr:glycosyltransferase family 39 protein [Candidatus Sumerlaeota bacterium]
MLVVVVLTAAGGWLRAREIERRGPLAPPDQKLDFDAWYYYVSAGQALLEGRGLTPAYNERDPPPVYLVPPPLQALFTAAVYAVRGAFDPAALVWTQLGLSLLAGGLVYWLLARWHGVAAALCGVAIWMLYPEFIYWVATPMTEANYLVLLLLVLALLAAWCDRRATGWALAAAAALGIANLQRPNGLGWGLAVAAFALWRLRGDERRWLQATIFAAAPFLVLLPWLARNVLVTGDPVLVSSNGGVLLYAVNHPGYDPLVWPDYGVYPAAEWHAQPILDRFNSAEFDGRRTYYQLSKLYAREVRAYVLAEPLHFLRNYVIKLWQRFALVPRVLAEVDPWLGERTAALLYHGLTLLGLAGLIGRRREWRNPRHVLLAISFGWFAAFAALMHWLGSGRMTITLRLFLMLFAAVFLGACLNGLTQKLASRPSR